MWGILASKTFPLRIQKNDAQIVFDELERWGYNGLMIRREKQFEFGGQGFNKPGDKFGGSLLKGNPKSKRPLATTLPIHLILRAAQGGLRLPKTFGKVTEIIDGTTKKYGVRIYQSANAGNHIHLVIKISNLKLWPAFIRELSGRIAQVVGELIGLAKGAKFWLFRPFTRIVRSWQKAFKAVKEYVYLNQLEANGFISRKETKSLKDLGMTWADG